VAGVLANRKCRGCDLAVSATSLREVVVATTGCYSVRALVGSPDLASGEQAVVVVTTWSAVVKTLGGLSSPCWRATSPRRWRRRRPLKR
jgi:hypothetical protein